ncbi:MAG: hypothetical protein H7Z76_10505 [Methylotenera sp.]|nr:hypothetical protein [Flavobacterium sp.]
MKNLKMGFNNVVETMYNMPLDEKEELKSLLENNIADTRRGKIAANYKKAQAEHKKGKLKFSSNSKDLKKMM